MGGRLDYWDAPAVTTTTSTLQTDAGWDGSYYRVRAEGSEALFLPSPDEVLDEVCNVDVEIHLPDGFRWSATIFTLAEVDRLMRRWEGTGEAAGGQCLTSSGASLATVRPILSPSTLPATPHRCGNPMGRALSGGGAGSARRHARDYERLVQHSETLMT